MQKNWECKKFIRTYTPLQSILELDPGRTFSKSGIISREKCTHFKSESRG